MKTELKNRTLWADGVSVIHPNQLEDALTSGVPLSSLAVTEMTNEVVRLNRLSDSKLSIKTELSKSFPPNWSLPDKYKYLSTDDYLLELARRIPETDPLYSQRVERLAHEYELFIERDLLEVLKALIYLIDELTKAKVVWGVGRGSSCSSYLLYMLGLHAVDCVLYDIPVTDFIR